MVKNKELSRPKGKVTLWNKLPNGQILHATVETRLGKSFKPELFDPDLFPQ